jgi:hypothetical protein
MKSRIFALSLILLPASLDARPARLEAQNVKVNGRVESFGPIRVLRVWGTPKEMGFAHGYLLGATFLDHFEEFLMHGGDTQSYDLMLRWAVARIELPSDVREEIQGIYDGMEAVLDSGQLGLPMIGRPLSVDDLILLNARDIHRGYGCSGFTVWGERAGDAGVITGRNFDYSVPGRLTLGGQMILVRAPVGKKQVATVTWPGYIGAFTGINEDGVCTFLHDGNGQRPTQQGKDKVTPLPVVLKELLEGTTPEAAHRDAHAALKAAVPYPRSYMVRIVTPRVPGTVDVPERVFRIDGSPELGENGRWEAMCLTTNHYVRGEGAAEPDPNDDSIRRFDVLRERLAAAVTPAQAWASLDAVAASGRDSPTLHALLVFPERRRLDLALAWWADEVQPATRRKPTPISFDDLFRRGAEQP